MGGLCPPPTPHALASTPERHHTRSAPSPEARGPPLGGSMRPCAAPGLRGHTAWLGVGRRGSTGGFSVGAEQARARTPFASPTGDSAIRRPRRSGAQGVACALRARTARIRLRDGRGCWWRVSTQSASPHRSPVCTDVDGEEVAGSHAWAAWSVLSSCTHARARRVGRGGNERAHTARAIASRGRIGGGARCTPRGRGRLSRGRGRVTGTRGSHNDPASVS